MRSTGRRAVQPAAVRSDLRPTGPWDQRREPDADPVGQGDHHIKRGINLSSFDGVDPLLVDAGPGGKVSDADSLALPHLPDRLPKADQLSSRVHMFLS